MTRIADLIAALDRWAPPHLAESYDNVGLHTGQPAAAFTGALVALEITPAVLDEAQAVGANLVITHHPLWFRPRKHLRGDDFVSHCLLLALERGLALFALHTNLDNVSTGVNSRIAQRLGLLETRILQPLDATGQTGAGLVGRLPAPLPEADFRQHLRQQLHTPLLRYVPGPPLIERVALCGGAGSFLIETAMKAGADAFVTGDITHHYFFEPQGRLLLVDAGHYETEQFTAQLIFEYLCGQFPQLLAENRLHLSTQSTNPVRLDWGTAPEA
jgi:dinuclear metal center YbgI/SA1388 family protein